MNWLHEVQWSPYAVGIGIGVLSWLTWLISKKPIGCSTSFARSAGMIEKLIRGGQVEDKPYYQEVKPVVDWQWMLVVGMVDPRPVGGGLWDERAATGPCGPAGWHPARLWRPLGRRLYQRAWDQWHHANGGVQLDLGHLLLLGWDHHGADPIRSDCVRREG